MKQFIYDVMGFEFMDTEAFGKGWQEAKTKAAELHSPIYRTVVKGDTVRYEAFYKGGVFNDVRFIKEDNLYIF